MNFSILAAVPVALAWDFLHDPVAYAFGQVFRSIVAAVLHSVPPSRPVWPAVAHFFALIAVLGVLLLPSPRLVRVVL